MAALSAEFFGSAPAHDPEFEQRLRADLAFIARPRHARWDEFGLLAVRGMLLERLRALGPVEEHHFQEGGDAGVNLIVKLPAQRNDLDPILVAAHYDGPLGSPGADDNASAVAALLELGRRWLKRPPLRPVWLVAFDQEEWGMVGSGVLARELGEPVSRVAVVARDLAGYALGQAMQHPSPSETFDQLIARGHRASMAGSLRGAGDTRFIMWATTIGMWGVRVPIALVTGYLMHLGVLFVWSAMIADWTVRMALLVWRYQSERWKQITVIKSAHGA